ncbi:dihydrodipicolinate synthase family protein [Parahaliea mediterranea]|uniref:dihydrodipicolinate synthase family protein n=1 Tax=Parahaliea mediterranea TaxID=651086 RepID=UPI000E2F7CA3|nr:dihydrodipicolinate synthase family protein [Parahaliea mediterranea]
MDRNSVDWRGYIPALTTPFTADGAFDIEATRQLHRWVYDNGVHGFIIMGTQGEWFSMSTEEKHALMHVAGDQFAGKLTLIAGCSAYTATEVLQNIEVARAAGMDGVLLTAPPYIMPTEEEIYRFFEEVSDNSALPICVYNWPPGTHVDLSLPLLTRLADLDKVVAIKNSTPNLRHFMDVFFTLKDKVRVFGIPMNELGITLTQHHNADGTMGAGAVLGPDQPGFFNAIWEGDIQRARQLGQRDSTIMKDWFTPGLTGRFGSAQSIFKEALNQLGQPGGHPRRPILPLDDSGVEKVRATLDKLGLLAS